MDKAPAPDEALPPSLRLLKGLVIVLMVTMIAGLIAIVTLLVIRMPGESAALGGDLVLPKGLHLPAGAKPQAITQGKGWIAVVTETGRILVFDGKTGALRHDYALE